ncbi:MAG TPA: YbdK family carboxylate-amine ligase [Desulfocapsa sulfexigens]|nr:YbdK family carboxylate-amine ligase [Desulfocapsa sulfexigens]
MHKLPRHIIRNIGNYKEKGVSMPTETEQTPLTFKFSPSYTLGVELEFQTLDKHTLNLAPFAPILLETAPAILRPRITQEWIRSILEIRTGICKNVRDVENDLLQTCSMAEELAAENNCLLYAASLHPFARAEDQLLTSDPRYERIMEELQIVGRRFISQGFHVHVGMIDGDTAIKVCDKIQPYLPLFLALSASSPFYEGRDTGLMSYRTNLFEALPLAGIYEEIGDWKTFLYNLKLLREAGVIESIKDLWWDARPHPGFGTLEIRACDLPTQFGDILGLTALIQAFVATLAESKLDAVSCNQQFLRSNKWQAVRYGLAGTFLDPLGFLGGGKMTIREGVQSLVEKVQPMVNRFGSERYMNMLDRILKDGPGADCQRRTYLKSKDFKDVVKQSHENFWT